MTCIKLAEVDLGNYSLISTLASRPERSMLCNR